MRNDTGRIVAGTVAIAAILPYLTLKTLWMTGNPVGVHEPDLMAGSEMTGLNAMTLGLDLVALVLAVGFTFGWGRRLPAWLVLLPLWVGTGLLVPIVVGLPVTLALDGPGAFATGPLESWVYVVVYGGFTVQGLALGASLVIYARDRWPAVFAGRYGGAVPALMTLLARGALGLCAVIGGVRLYWALGGTAGLDPAMAAGLSLSGAVQQAFTALLTIAGGVAFLALVRGARRVPYLFVAWLGTGSLFAWGLYSLILLAVGGPLRPEGVETAVPSLVDLFSTMTGLVMGVAGAVELVSGGRVVQPAQDPLEGDDRDRDRATADQGHH
ncbi:hypothetical protein ACIBG7_00060 [Nonomuraea sp. NPDC050328]|uniref:hypothetical protein n=1 Tax=Nonomuraea sp. NPDC050328 TaxID=3364361 RepID=UPI0037B9120B